MVRSCSDLHSIWTVNLDRTGLTTVDNESMEQTMSKRQYGSGQLYVQGANYYGRWRNPSDSKRNRKVGPVRKPGTSEGLTKVQAEKKLAEMIAADDGATRLPASECPRPERRSCDA